MTDEREANFFEEINFGFWIIVIWPIASLKMFKVDYFSPKLHLQSNPTFEFERIWTQNEGWTTDPNLFFSVFYILDFLLKSTESQKSGGQILRANFSLFSHAFLFCWGFPTKIDRVPKLGDFGGPKIAGFPTVKKSCQKIKGQRSKIMVVVRKVDNFF